MDNREENRALVAFTWLAPLSVGGTLGLLALRGINPGAPPDWFGAIPFGVGVLALAASLLHLSRPHRAYRALLRLSTSWLSREVILFGTFLFFLALYSLPPLALLHGDLRGLSGLLATVLGLVSLFATGQVYRLPSRPAWDHWSATVSFPLGALSAGLLLGIDVARPEAWGAPAGRAAATVAAVALLLALTATWTRSWRLRGGDSEQLAAWRLVMGSNRWALALRTAGCLCALLLLMVGGWAAALAWIPAALGELGDRVLFFYGVVPVSFAARSGVPAVSRQQLR